MRKIFVVLGIVAVVLVCAGGMAQAALTMTVDDSYIDFKSMDPGQDMELSQRGVYHNQVSCTSTNNKAWYLKARLIKPFSSGMNTIPSGNFLWKVVSAGSGRGTVYNSVNTENAFSTDSGLIYTSADTDNTGTQVDLQFRYILRVPENQAAGSYNAAIRLTMTEIL